ncbi:dUTP diphosphatase [Bacillus sp. V3B]|uniref:dUTP diphosphatase n=1 Tax=Bacillus sp. V3B TaxID=2804915 RepID=UPI00210B5D64|nr:dUTP diphosphatase [Bacillus sp. V3B]MCQ6275775.1 dUTP diphosphatase [Bacillus sp. V3B]
MNIEKMLEMQKVLDDRITAEKNLEGQDLFPNTVLALQVELAEFANEGRWFKHWSNDQEPRTFVPNPDDVCKKCDGQGMLNMKAPLRGRTFCDECDGCGVHFHNPLLEEYVDSLHFFLSIANQKGWQDTLYIYEEDIEETREEGFDGGLTGIFLEMNYWLSKSIFEKSSSDKNEPFEKIARAIGLSRQEYLFKTAWFLFIAIGLVGFNFTEEQVEEAYFSKNAVNHARQDSGY